MIYNLRQNSKQNAIYNFMHCIIQKAYEQSEL